jgi:hypothetical protein
MGPQRQTTTVLGIPHESGSNAKFFASAQSASFQNVSATYSGHSFSEAVGFCTFSFIWIIGKAHGLSPEIEVE